MTFNLTVKTNQLNFNDFFTFFDKLINIRLTFNEFVFDH